MNEKERQTDLLNSLRTRLEKVTPELFAEFLDLRVGKEIKCLPTRHCFPFFSVSVCFIFYFIHTLSRMSLHRQLVFYLV